MIQKVVLGEQYCQKAYCQDIGHCIYAWCVNDWLIVYGGIVSSHRPVQEQEPRQREALVHDASGIHALDLSNIFEIFAVDYYPADNVQ